ncbi:hypothetical protein CGCVW01_v006559 [Colletotrichum viniferum]|nr:hypothetical protein CGCVW01_v006559 [Colletotrichum viniferum]
MAKFLGFLAVLLMAANVNANKHRLCACITDQGDIGMQIDEEASKAVVKASEGKFVYSDSPWFPDPLDGAPYSGRYFHAIEGDVNGANDDGWLGGDEVNGLCGAQFAESSCWTPSDVLNWRRCGASGICWTSKAAKTDGFGTPI